MSRPATSASRWTLWDWPFLEPEHHELARRTVAWNAASHALHDNVDFTERCRAIVKSLGDAGLLDQVVPQEGVAFDVSSLCVIREALTYEEALADAMYTMQGIGTHAIQSFGTVAQKQRYLPPCRSGDKVADFALTEPATGSGGASMTTSAVRDGGEYVINGDKRLIPNAGFAGP